ncbi:hypothetical protein Ct61P_15049 [Colletotrichum tofieldiae]|nr:hypothetical protein Ct61P_15049 [Colletotrichum tofieldiae]
MLLGEEVTTWERTRILKRAAGWVNKELNADDLEFHDTPDDAVAVLIYVTRDAEGQDILDHGIVLFADEGTEGFITGEYAEESGVWLFPVPKRGLFVDKAQVEYIRIRKRET